MPSQRKRGLHYPGRADPPLEPARGHIDAESSFGSEVQWRALQYRRMFVCCEALSEKGTAGSGPRSARFCAIAVRRRMRCLSPAFDNIHGQASQKQCVDIDIVGRDPES